MWNAQEPVTNCTHPRQKKVRILFSIERDQENVFVMLFFCNKIQKKNVKGTSYENTFWLLHYIFQLITKQTN